MAILKNTLTLSGLLAITFACAAPMTAGQSRPKANVEARPEAKSEAKSGAKSEAKLEAKLEDQELSKKIIVVPDEPPLDWASERLVALAACYKNMGAPERAKKALRLAIKNDKTGKVKKQAQMLLDSELPKYPVPQEAVSLSNQAYDHYGRKQYASAIKTAKECAAKYPKYEAPLDTLSAIYLEQKKPQLARETSKKALAINDKCSNAWLSLGNSYLLEGDYKSARAAAEKSLQCYPDNINTKAMIKFMNTTHR